MANIDPGQKNTIEIMRMYIFASEGYLMDLTPYKNTKISKNMIFWDIKQYKLNLIHEKMNEKHGID